MRQKIIKKKKFILNNSVGYEYLDKIDKIYYINLEHRKDRDIEIRGELSKIDPTFKKIERFNAISHDNGAIGCALSHIAVLEDAIKHNYENIIVFEDDFELIVPVKIFNKYMNNLFDTVDDFNICTISSNIFKYNEYIPGIIELLNAQTTSSFIVNKQFFHTLKDNFSVSVDNLKMGKPSNKFAIDQYWKILQGKDKKFYGMSKKLAIQRKSYSDIEKKVVNYGL